MIAAVMMVRDEADIIVPVVAQLIAQGVDAFWIADNLSCDETRPLLEKLAAGHPITIIDDDVVGFYQAQKMTHLARMAMADGADWIIPADADEWWYGTGATIAEALAGAEADVVKAYGYDHVPQPADDPGEADPVRRIVHRRGHTQTFPKVVFRAHPDAYIHMGNHEVERPGARQAGLLQYRHFGYRSLEQMTRKVRQGKAAYDASTIHETHGAHWRRLGALDDAGLEAEWAALLTEQGLIRDPAPW